MKTFFNVFILGSTFFLHLCSRVRHD